MWSLTKFHKSKPKICQRAMGRNILGFKRIDRLRNTMLRSIIGIADEGSKAARHKWDRAGYVRRMQTERWANVTSWMLEDEKRRQKTLVGRSRYV